MGEDNGREEFPAEGDGAQPSRAQGAPAGPSSSEDLPDYLRTEPIPVQRPPASEEPDAAPPSFPGVPGREPESAETLFAPSGPTEEMAPVPDKQPKKGRRAALIAGGVILVLGLAYVGAAWYFADKVPADTTVAGVDISHLDRPSAEARLASELEEVLTSPIAVTLADTETSIEPDEAGLNLDIPATVDQLVGLSLKPASVFGHLFGVGEFDPVMHVDTATTRQALNAVSPDLSIAPVEGEVAIVDGEVEIVEPEDGVSVDVDAAVAVLTEEWLQGARPVQLPDVAVPPTVGEDVIERTRKTILDPLFSGDVPLSINDAEATVPADDIARAATLSLADGAYELRLNEEQISDVVGELLPELGESPKPARIELKDGKPHIVKSVTGAGINPGELAEVVAEAAVQTGEQRRAALELETTEPDFTTEDAEALKVTERVSYFSTPVPYDPVRTKNLVTGAKNLNGILIKPGETFSLIEALGPIDAAHGYVSSGVVVNGFESEAMGGGLSQISTTVFNAAFEAGMEDVTHQPHSRHFSRYPEGREATMFLPHLDMKWRNNTPYGVLVQAWIDDKTNVALWSTKYWDTKITTGPRTRFVQPQTVYNPAPNCVPERGGSAGFTVTVQRIVSKDGVRNDEYSRSYSHTYQPWNHVICGTKPKPGAESESSSDSEED